MADNSAGNKTQTSVWRRVSRLSRYDLVLAAIPLAFVPALVAATLFALPFHGAVASGAVVSALLLADALYFNPPTESPPDAPRR